MADRLRLEWRGDFRFDGMDSRGNSVPIDAEARAGAKGSDLLPLSLAACLAWDVVNVMRKSRQDLSGLTAEIEFRQDPEPPFTFRRISVGFVLAGDGLDGSVVERAVRLAQKDCSVLHSLSPTVEVVVSARTVSGRPGADGTNEPSAR